MKSRTFPKAARSYRFPMVPARISPIVTTSIHRGFFTAAKTPTMIGTARMETMSQIFFAPLNFPKTIPSL